MRREIVDARKGERMRFGRMVKTFRRGRGWTYAELARAVRVDSVQSVQQWEAGKYVANARHLSSLADVMGVPPEELVATIYGARVTNREGGKK